MGRDNHNQVSWDNLKNKPNTYPSDWENVANKPSSFGLEIGDVLNTFRNPGEKYLACDGSVYLQSSYTELFSKIGYLGNPFIPFHELSSLDLAAHTARAIAFNGSMYVLSGGTGDAPYFLKYSDDLINWTDCVVTGLSETMYKITYGNGYFIGISHSRELMRSSDGINWSELSVFSSSGILPNSYDSNSKLGYENGIFFVIDGDVVWKSADNGDSWTYSTIGSSSYLQSLTYGSGIWIVGGGNAGFTSRIYTSDDLTTWTSRSISTGGNPENIRAIAFGNDTFVCGGHAGSILTSPDGITWTLRTSPFSGIYEIRFNSDNNYFYATGSNYAIYSSPDGITWTQLPITTTSNCFDLTFKDGYVYAFAFDGSVYRYKYGVDYDGNTSFQVPNLTANDYIKAEN